MRERARRGEAQTPNVSRPHRPIPPPVPANPCCGIHEQANGRVERAGRTLQDRLAKELRLAGISDMEEANAFLPSLPGRHDARFAKAPRRQDDLHRALDVEPDRLRDVLRLRGQRHVGAQLSLSCERHRIILEENDVTRGLPGRYADAYADADAVPDGRPDIRRNGGSLPYSAFDEGERVAHAAITWRKRPSTVLEFIDSERHKSPPKARPAGKQRTRYTQTGQGNDGWISAAERIAKTQAAQAAGQGFDPRRLRPARPLPSVAPVTPLVRRPSDTSHLIAPWIGSARSIMDMASPADEDA